MKLLKFLLYLVFIQTSNADTIVIKNEIPDVNYELTRTEILWMFTMKTRFWYDGTKITVFYLDRTSTAHKNFCKNILRISPEKFDNILNSKLNEGNAGSFRLVRNQDDLLYKVSLIDGSIGYYDDSLIFINEGDYVKKINIID